ncbi:hypothetical protein CspHIS471_0601080 [Cutaneotrichosporon sp. HIS471]|nr:hypothetical protein CspHIS471_0601080 [Cutaneotrichosporon sp. HIS471]
MKRTYDDSEPDLTPNPTPQKPKRRAYTKDVKPRVRRPSPSPSQLPDPNRDTKPDLDTSDVEDKKPSMKKTGGGGRKWTAADRRVVPKLLKILQAEKE